MKLDKALLVWGTPEHAGHLIECPQITLELVEDAEGNTWYGAHLLSGDEQWERNFLNILLFAAVWVPGMWDRDDWELVKPPEAPEAEEGAPV